MDQISPFHVETDFQVTYDRDVPCVVMVWRGYHDSASFRANNWRVLAALIEHGASQLLGDVRHFLLIGATDQDWLNREWLPRVIEAGLTTCALVVPVYYFNRVAVNTVVERMGTSAVRVEYFDAPEPARRWLQSASSGPTAAREMALACRP